MASLPSVLVISVNTATTPERYLSFSGPDSILRFGPDEGVFSAHAKFAIEPAGNDLFHIRSCYNNHYWVREVESEPWLSVSATMPQGDSTRERCTLFKATVRGGVEVQFEHVSSGLKVVMQPADSGSPYVLGLEDATATVFGCIDYASLIKLPKYVMFVSGQNHTYLNVDPSNDRAYLFLMRYGDPSHPTDQSIGFESSVARNGDVMLKSLTTGKFWRLESNKWILADFNAAGSPESLFEAVQSRAWYIGLRCRANNKFCRRLTEDGVTSALAATADSVADSYSLLRPQNYCKMATSRITIESYRHARIFNTRTQETTLRFNVENPSSQTTEETLSATAYEDNRTIRWDNSDTVGHNGGICTIRVPYISESGQVEVPDEGREILYFWAADMPLPTTISASARVSVPARSRVEVTLIAKIATCEVPFSYLLEDELFVGGTVSDRFIDGVFTGVNTYAFEARIDRTVPLNAAVEDQVGDGKVVVTKLDPPGTDQGVGDAQAEALESHAVQVETDVSK